MPDLACKNGVSPGHFPVAGLANVLPQATLQDMPFFTGIMRDHALLIRSGVDPTQATVVEQAECFAGVLNPLVAETCFFPPMAHPAAILMLIQETLPPVVGLRNFKVAIYEAIKEGRALGGIVPPQLIDHIRREADWYIGLLGHNLCMPPVTRGTLGLCDGRDSAFTLPRAALAFLPPEAVTAATLEAIQFWARIHAEHAEVLASETIPVAQERLRRDLTRFAPPMYELVRAARAAECGRRDPHRPIKRAINLSSKWVCFLKSVVEAVIAGDVPMGHTNFWPLLADHIYRESQYSLDLFRLGHTAVTRS
ncbi:MAG: DUF2935 domain-containing protein [Firmicutes bacterium]|nr:DUF2935 domain-containing protein [Bacillota bacterium]